MPLAAEDVRARSPLGDSRGEHGLTDGLLHYGFVKVMAPESNRRPADYEFSTRAD
jgi:hypothetical protein